MSQGKTYENDERIYGAANAVDKNLASLSATLTDNGAGWLKFKFDKTYNFNKVVIYYWFYTNWYDPYRWCANSEANFRKCVESHNNVDVSVYQGEVKRKSCGTLQLTYGLEQADQIYTLLCNTHGDTVKLSKSTGSLVVPEVVMTGFALGKFLTMVS